MIYNTYHGGGYEMSNTGDTAETLDDIFLLSLSAVELASWRHKEDLV